MDSCLKPSAIEIFQKTSVAAVYCQATRPAVPRDGRHSFANHADGIAAIDRFVVPTISVSSAAYRLLHRGARPTTESYGLGRPTAHPNRNQIT